MRGPRVLPTLAGGENKSDGEEDGGGGSGGGAMSGAILVSPTNSSGERLSPLSGRARAYVAGGGDSAAGGGDGAGRGSGGDLWGANVPEAAHTAEDHKEAGKQRAKKEGVVSPYPARRSFKNGPPKKGLVLKKMETTTMLKGMSFWLHISGGDDLYLVNPTYIECIYNGSEVGRSEVRDDGPTPLWNTQFCVSLGAGEEVGDLKLQATDRVLHHVIGELTIRGEDLLEKITSAGHYKRPHKLSVEESFLCHTTTKKKLSLYKKVSTAVGLPRGLQPGQGPNRRKNVQVGTDYQKQAQKEVRVRRQYGALRAHGTPVRNLGKTSSPSLRVTIHENEMDLREAMSLVALHHAKVEHLRSAPRSYCCSSTPKRVIEGHVHHSHFIMLPTHSRVQRWDVIAIVALLYCAVITPYEVGVMGAGSRSLALTVFNTFVDMIFVADFSFQFFLAYYDEFYTTWVYDPPSIARRYMSHWGIIDIIAILPLHLLNQKLRVMRLLKILRLAKLFKILRASRILTQIQQRMGIRFAFVSLIKYAVGSIFLMHWVACGFAFLPDIQNGFRTNEKRRREQGRAPSWLDQFDDQYKSSGTRSDRRSLLFWGISPEEASRRSLRVDSETYGKSLDDSDWRIYTQSFEFAVMTMVLGYGIAEPVTQLEQGYAIICMICMGSFYAYMIASVCGIISVMDPAMTEYHNNMDLLNQFMAEQKLSGELKNRCRDYFRFCKDHFTSKYYSKLLMQMSPAIRGEFAEHFHGIWIRQISFFNCPNPEERGRFVVEVAITLTLEGYARGEFVYHKGDPSQAMFIIRRGIVGSNGRVLRPGRFFGEDMIIGETRQGSASVLSFLDVHRLNKDSLNEILHRGTFPDTCALIKRQRIKMRFHVAFRTLLGAIRMQPGYQRVTPEQLVEWKEQRHIVLHESWLELQNVRNNAVAAGRPPTMFNKAEPTAAGLARSNYLDPEIRRDLDKLLKFVEEHERKRIASDAPSRAEKAFEMETTDSKLSNIRHLLEVSTNNNNKLVDRLERMESLLFEIVGSNRSECGSPSSASRRPIRPYHGHDDDDDVSVVPAPMLSARTRGRAGSNE